MAAESLANVKFIQEKKLINSYFDQISQDTGKYFFGVDDTLQALEMGPQGIIYSKTVLSGVLTDLVKVGIDEFLLLNEFYIGQRLSC